MNTENNESTIAFVNVGRGGVVHYAFARKYSNSYTHYSVLCNGNSHSRARLSQSVEATCSRCKRVAAAIPNFKG